MVELNHPQTKAVVIGASGQDGYFLTERLLEEGWTVHAHARRAEEISALASLRRRGMLYAHAFDSSVPSHLFELIARERPAEIYNLAGQSSVSRSFDDPLLTWRTNADFVAELLECVRLRSPHTRLYQASSTDMFGGTGGGTHLYDENSRLGPQSPYASAKAAAHLLCDSYRRAFGLRISCGILSNHESHRRPPRFLTRKITDHVRALKDQGESAHRSAGPLRMGNLKVARDWGFAPDYVEGMMLIMRQIKVRSERAAQSDAQISDSAGALRDNGHDYRDYVLGTGRTHAVWEMVDEAFRLAGFELEWQLEGDEPARWRATFRHTGETAVEVDPSLLRPADPLVIRVDVTRARRELGWMPREGLNVFLEDMLKHPPRAARYEPSEQ